MLLSLLSRALLCRDDGGWCFHFTRCCFLSIRCYFHSTRCCFHSTRYLHDPCMLLAWLTLLHCLTHFTSLDTCLSYVVSVLACYTVKLCLHAGLTPCSVLASCCTRSIARCLLTACLLPFLASFAFCLGRSALLSAALTNARSCCDVCVVADYSLCLHVCLCVYVCVDLVADRPGGDTREARAAT